jgi:hypothetical protein
LGLAKLLWLKREVAVAEVRFDTTDDYERQKWKKCWNPGRT